MTSLRVGSFGLLEVYSRLISLFEYDVHFPNVFPTDYPHGLHEIHLFTTIQFMLQLLRWKEALRI